MLTRWKVRRAERRYYAFAITGARPHTPTLIYVQGTADGAMLLHFSRVGLHRAERRVSLWATMTEDGLVLHRPDECCYANNDHDPLGDTSAVRSLHHHLSAQLEQSDFFSDLIRGYEATRTLWLLGHGGDKPDPSTAQYRQRMDDFDVTRTLLDLHDQPRPVRQLVLAMLPTATDPTTLIDVARSAVAA